MLVLQLLQASNAVNQVAPQVKTLHGCATHESAFRSLLSSEMLFTETAWWAS